VTALDFNTATSLPRARGEVVLSAKRRGAASVLDRLRQAGSLKALFPRSSGGPLEAVVLNTAGGLTGGDRMRLSAEAGPGTALTLSTQAAERVYRALPGSKAGAGVSLTAMAGARIEWLPQETILYDGAALDRRLRLTLAADAAALVVEPLILGRAAMGEVVRDAHLTDRWEVTRDGALIFADALRLSGDIAALMDRAAIGGGARAMATLLYIGPDAAARREALRAAVGDAGGASLVRDGVLFARMLAADGFALRARLIPAIATLAQGPLPKVWRL